MLLIKKCASIISVSGEGIWSDNDEDWLVRKILQTLAEYERKVIAARTKTAMIRYQANGRRRSNKPVLLKNQKLLISKDLCKIEIDVLNDLRTLHQKI